jgi:CRP-like cAMP-binding protein
MALTEHDRFIVENARLFRKVPREEIELLFDERAVVLLGKGQILFDQGEEAAASYIVLQGQIKLTRLGVDGDEAIIDIFTEGDSFAEAAMFLGGRYPVSATAISDARLLPLPTATLQARIAERPQLAMAMLGSMSLHLLSLVAQIEQMKLLTGEERVIQYLLALGGVQEGSVAFNLPHEKNIIANRLGIKPETFSRALSQLRRLGVDVNGARVVIQDVARLRILLPQP